MSSPRLALAGAGPTAALHGLAARVLGLPVAAVADPDPTLAGERARQVGAPVADLDQLAGTGAEVVAVGTPLARRGADALAALAAGATVVVDPPLCATLAEADRLVAAALAPAPGRPGDAGPALVYGESLAFAPIVEQALAHVRRIGAVTHLEAHALQARPLDPTALAPGAGGGALLQLGAHPLALVLLAAGPARVVGVRARLEGGAGHDLDEVADVWLQLDSGAQAHVAASWRGGEPMWDFQAASATGVVRAELLPSLALERNGEPVPFPPARPGLELPRLEEFGHLGVLDAARRSALGAPPGPGGAGPGAALGRDVLEVVCAAYRSAGRDGAPVALPLADGRDRSPVAGWRSPS